MQDKIYKVLQKYKQNINNVYINYKQIYIKRINKVYKNVIRKIVKNQLLHVHLISKKLNLEGLKIFICNSLYCIELC